MRSSSTVAAVISALFVTVTFTSFKELADIELPDFLADAGHYQFLTNIALLLSCIYFAVNLLYHTLEIHALKPAKQYLSAVCLSLNFVVSVVYWGLKFFIPHLILAKGETIPLLLDVKIHALPVLCTAIDYFVFMDRWYISYFRAYTIISVCATLYWFWLEHLITENASYPYPFLNVERNLRIVIFIIVSLIAFGAFCLGKLLHPSFLPKLQRAEHSANTHTLSKSD